MMSTTTIIVAISVCLFLLVAVTFILQQIEKNNREKKQLVAAMKTRARNFQQLLTGFPDGFLSRDLRLLVCQCLNDAFDQLIRLEPRNPQHRQEQDELAALRQQVEAQPDQAGAGAPLLDPNQIQAVQKLLHSLLNVVNHLGQAGRLLPAQATEYSRQIQRLATRAALDGHLGGARQAQQAGKPRLAVHYYRLAVEKMQKSNADGSYTNQIQSCQQRIAELEAIADKQPDTDVEANPTDDAWKEFGQDRDAWKKKSVYD